MCFHSHIIYIVCDYLLNRSFHLRLSGNTGAIGFQRLCYGSLINSVGNLPHVGDFLFREPMAGHLMARRQFNQLRFLLLATFCAVGAAVAEGTTRRQIQRAGRLALDILDFLGKVHLGIKDGIQQCP